jgi:hypothetical protein
MPVSSARPTDSPKNGGLVVVAGRLDLLRAGLARILGDAGYNVEQRARSDLIGPEADLIVFVVREHGAWKAFERIGQQREVVAVLSEPGWCPDALKAGATSIVLEDASPEAFLLAVAAAQAGLTVVPRQTACLMHRMEPSLAMHALEIPERQWLLALSEGLTVARLARQCSFSEREMHRLAAVYKRLDATCRARYLWMAALASIWRQTRTT